MRTRRSPRNQEILWRALGKEGETPKPDAPKVEADTEPMWWLSSRTKRMLERDKQRSGIRNAARAALSHEGKAK